MRKGHCYLLLLQKNTAKDCVESANGENKSKYFYTN